MVEALLSGDVDDVEAGDFFAARFASSSCEGVSTGYSRLAILPSSSRMWLHPQVHPVFTPVSDVMIRDM
jgi:hypothetical protein